MSLGEPSVSKNISNLSNLILVTEGENDTDESDAEKKGIVGVLCAIGFFAEIKI